jgi:hypothetical protein
MRSSWTIGFNGYIEVHKDKFARKFDDDGKKRLFQWNPYKQAIHVHPDYWDEFCAHFEAIGSPTDSDGERAVDSGDEAAKQP